MNLIAFDTSTDACSVALQCDDRLFTDHRLESRNQAALLLPMIDALVAEAGVALKDVDVVVYGRGPGSFTGVRIAVAAAQGLSLSLQARTLGVSSLAALAQAAHLASGAKRVIATLDARMNEVYLGDYECSSDSGVMVPVSPDRVCDPAELSRADAAAVFVGPGAEVYAQHLPGSLETGVLPTAEALLVLAGTELQAELAGARLGQPGDAEPVYLRDKVALTEAERAGANS